MKNTIGYKMTKLIVIIMLISIVIAAVFGRMFMSGFYNASKQSAIKDIYSKLDQVVTANTIAITDADREALDEICERNGASLIVIDSTGASIYEFGGARMLIDRWEDMIFGDVRQQMYDFTVIEDNEEYILQHTKDRATNNQYYELSGVLDNSSYFIARMSVENINESMSISNRFYLLFGVILMLAITVAIIFATRRYTKPLYQLADISKGMSNLNFNIKYTGDRKDEIGILGHSMNEMSDKLERTITELKTANIQLHQDIKKKEEIDEMRKEFIANVSHELKTPIALIQGYAEGLQDGIIEDPEDMKYYCEVISDEANKMNKMVKNLLNLNQLEYGEIQINLDRFDIVTVVKEIIKNFGLQAENQGVNVRIEDYEPIYVWADEFQIEEVVTNYLSNAFNHVDENKIIEVKIGKKNGIVRVSVFNTGKNIPENEIDNLWIKFYKVDKARTREYGGNGIGLSIVKAIMDRHEKSYGVRNCEGGVEFWFELDGSALEEGND